MSDWKFELNEVGPDAVEEDKESLQPGSPSPENVVFVVLGVLTTVLFFARLVSGVAGP